MGFHPAALLTGLLVVLLAADMHSTSAKSAEQLQSSKLDAFTMQSPDDATFHRGSGRLQSSRPGYLPLSV